MAAGDHTPRRRRVATPAGGVFVLRVWTGPDGELMGRAQWSTARGDTHAAVLGRSAAILAELQAFCAEAIVPQAGAEGELGVGPESEVR